MLMGKTLEASGLSLVYRAFCEAFHCLRAHRSQAHYTGLQHGLMFQSC